MPTSPLGLARERLRAIADSIATLTGSCAVFARREVADIESWRRYVPGDYYFLAVCESALAPGGITAPAAISVYLYSASDADGSAVVDLAAQLRTAWMNAGNYPGGEIVCSDVAFEQPEPLGLLAADPARPFFRTRLTCYFPGF